MFIHVNSKIEDIKSNSLDKVCLILLNKNNDQNSTEIIDKIKTTFNSNIDILLHNVGDKTNQECWLECCNYVKNSGNNYYAYSFVNVDLINDFPDNILANLVIQLKYNYNTIAVQPFNIPHLNPYEHFNRKINNDIPIIIDIFTVYRAGWFNSLDFNSLFNNSEWDIGMEIQRLARKDFKHCYVDKKTTVNINYNEDQINAWKQRIELEKLENARLLKERIIREKFEKEKAEQERLLREKVEKERLERERIERERLIQEYLEIERKEKIENLERERLKNLEIEEQNKKIEEEHKKFEEKQRKIEEEMKEKDKNIKLLIEEKEKLKIGYLEYESEISSKVYNLLQEKNRLDEEKKIIDEEKNRIDEEKNILKERQNDNFQVPVSIILLERNLDRTKHVNENILPILPHSNIFSAIDYKKVNIVNMMKKLGLNISINLKYGQLGCFLSHISLWKEMIRKNIKEMIILEDDVVIPVDFNFKMNELRRELVNDYDILYLFVHPYQYKNINSLDNSYKIPDKKHMVKRYSTYGTVGYLISNKGAQYLLKSIKMIDNPIDLQISELLKSRICFDVMDIFLTTRGKLDPNDRENARLSSTVFNSDIINLEEIKKEIELISVILPTYNRGSKCIKAIKDLIGQSNKNFELIIINDGSNDENSLIIETFIDSIQDQRIKYIKHNNIGTAASLNVGLSNLNGGYITWISDDNTIHPDFLEELLRPKAGFSYSNYSIFNGSTKSFINNKHNGIKDLINNFKGMCGFMWRKDIIEKVGEFNTDLSGLCDDYEYEIRTFLATNDIVHINKDLIDFYIGKDTQTSQNHSHMKETHKLVQNFYNLYLDKLSNKDKFVIGSTKEELTNYDSSYAKINIYNVPEEIERKEGLERKEGTEVYYENDILFVPKMHQNLVYGMLRNEEKSIIFTKDPKNISDCFEYVNDENSVKFISNISKTICQEKCRKKDIFQQEDIKISFIMAHKNRIDLLLLTLYNLNKSTERNFEVVIVDDRSKYDITFIEDLEFNYSIKLINEKDYHDNHICPGNLYNLAFKHSIGDIIVIQNPECIHLGDIPKYIIENFQYDDYLSFPCYSSNNVKVNDYIVENLDTISINNIENLTKKFNQDAQFGSYPVWYQHSIIADRNLHFCTVISREYFEICGGFSNNYSDGYCFEDDDLIFTIREKLKLNVKSIALEENVGVIHMYHGRSPIVNITPREKTVIKRSIYEQFNLNENIFNYTKRINNVISCPKLFHYYWDDFRKFSLLNLYSIKTSLHYHPDYIHIIWCPKNPEKNMSWSEFCNKEYSQDTDYEKYIDILRNERNVRIIYKDMDKFLEVDNNMSEIHKSDLFRYKILYKYGGIWSDLDIVYIKSITDIINYDFDSINFLCMSGIYYYYPIGLLISKRRNLLFKYIYDQAIENYKPDRYQCCGAELYAKIFKCNGYTKFITLSNGENIEGKNYNLDENFYMKYDWLVIDKLFISEPPNADLSKTVGFHWFNGSDITKEYLKEITNFKIPDKFKGIIFREKNKHIFTLVDTIKFLTFDLEPWAKFYKNKQDFYINILSKKYNTEIIYGGKFFNPVKNIYDDILNDKNSLYLFDELSYVQLLSYYNFNPVHRQKIKDFLINNRYIFFFCELFCNDSLQTIGNKIINKEFTLLFFKEATKVMLCNTKNFIYLIKNNIYENLVYFPPYGYSKINKIIEMTTNPIKNIDILFYGNILEDFSYRNSYIQKIKTFSADRNYNFKIYNYLHGDEKDEVLKDTKIVVHFPSHENTTTFPWAKITELMSKKIFIIIEENEEMYIRNLENVVVFYRDEKDLYEKIDFYVKNEDERTKNINKCYKYVTEKCDLDIFLNDMFKNV